MNLQCCNGDCKWTKDEYENYKLSNFFRNEERSDECRRNWSLFRHIMSCWFAANVQVLRKLHILWISFKIWIFKAKWIFLTVKLSFRHVCTNSPNSSSKRRVVHNIRFFRQFYQNIVKFQKILAIFGLKSSKLCCNTVFYFILCQIFRCDSISRYGVWEWVCKND